MRFYFKIDGITAAQAGLEKLPASIHEAMRLRMEELGRMLQSTVVNQALSGQVLHRRTGRLQASIYSRVSDFQGGVILHLGSSGVSYNAIHEYGGTTRAHAIIARRRSVLAYFQGGTRMFKRAVQHPGSRMPTRSYIRSTIAAQRQMIDQFIKTLIADQIRREGF